MAPANLRKQVLWFVVGIPLLYLIFLYPEYQPPIPSPLQQRAFVWDQDSQWKALEAQFVKLRPGGCEGLGDQLDEHLVHARDLITQAIGQQLTPEAPLFQDLESTLFGLAPMVAVCTERAPEYIGLVAWMRSVIKDQSLRWDLSSPATRSRLYRLLYGGRAACEEVLLQMPRSEIPPLTPGDDEPSQTPSASILGMTVHSGDILVSRGGVPISALIARGNDYPGNFSHVALVYVDESTNVPVLLESHIERGGTISSVKEYLADRKLRIMVLRLRSDLPAMVADPMLPHKAAGAMLAKLRGGHVPYDFAMDFRDTSSMFCSEIVSTAYQPKGVTLWMGLSNISNPGVIAWLADFGVRHFETQEPSDLEYDPQLRVVSEWRSADSLLQDHVDNAILESLLEGAELGERMRHAWYLLPISRLVKLYSVSLNAFGKVGPIPEGMSATAALRHVWLVRKHDSMNERIQRMVNDFKTAEGYSPPYWELLAMARKAKQQEE